MSENYSANLETRLYSLPEHLERICSDFEARLHQQLHPRIEDFLDLVASEERMNLLRKLVSIESQFACGGSSVDFSIYFDRFPESVEVLRSLQEEISTPILDIEATRIADQTLDDTRKHAPTIIPQLRRFQLIKKAGAGTFGAVWKAFDWKLHREVAVKFASSGPGVSIDLKFLLNEAQASAKLHHPNIVEVYDVDETSSAIVTNFVEGCNLRQWRGDRIVEPRQAAQLMIKLANAVQYAHAHGVIHRDLKPSNILMDLEGEPHIADFGLAKRELRDDTLAIPGQILGTLAYMAPEQARAEHLAVDRRSDIYSLGVILYELLTGRLPFQGEESLLLSRVIHDAPPHPKSINTKIPEELALICLKCLRKSPHLRYTSARELAVNLVRFLEGEVIHDIELPWSYRVSKWIERRYRRSKHVLAGLLFGIGLFGAYTWMSAPSTFMQQVVIETDPPGCAVSAVTIDPETGDPDPAKIKKLRGLTPIKAKLPPGDYFIVAVLQSRKSNEKVRFHEVFRHVPELNETPFLARAHNIWREDAAGRILLPKITIPSDDVGNGMVFIDDSIIDFDLIHNKFKSATTKIRVPGFRVDRSEVTIQEAEAYGSSRRVESAVPPLISARYDEAVAYAERIGKRIPFASELAALEAFIAEVDLIDRQSNSDNQGTQNLIQGVSSGVWEWTATRPGGLATGMSPHTRMGHLELKSRVLRNGPGSADLNGRYRNFQPRIQLEHQIDPMTGIRTVRSASPSLTPADFAAPVTSTSAPQQK